MKHLEKIILCLENTDSIEFNKNVIGLFHIDEINEEVIRISSDLNGINKIKKCNDVMIEIFKEGNELYNEFGILNETKYKFSRIIECKDITSIELVYEDGTKEEIYVPYDEDEYERNTKMNNTIVTDVGNLYILITREEITLKEFFDVNNYFINDIAYEFDKFCKSEEFNECRKKLFDINKVEHKTHLYSEDDLPELYRLVYLIYKDKNDRRVKDALACRVYDRECEWKFIFQDPKDNLHFFHSWKYIDDDMFSILNKKFNIKDILEKYPPFNIDR